ADGPRLSAAWGGGGALRRSSLEPFSEGRSVAMLRQWAHQLVAPAPGHLLAATSAALTHVDLEQGWEFDMNVLPGGRMVSPLRAVIAVAADTCVARADDGQVSWWRWRDHTFAGEWSSGAVSAIGAVADDAVIVGYTDGAVGTGERDRPHPPELAQHRERVTAVTRLDGRVVSADARGTVFVHTGDKAPTGPHQRIVWVARHGTGYLTLGAEGLVVQWDLALQAEQRCTLGGGTITTAAVHPHEPVLAVFDDTGRVAVLEVDRWEVPTEAWFMGRDLGFATKAAFDDTGRMLALTREHDGTHQVVVLRWPALHVLASTEA